MHEIIRIHLSENKLQISSEVESLKEGLDLVENVVVEAGEFLLKMANLLKAIVTSD